MDSQHDDNLIPSKTAGDPSVVGLDVHADSDLEDSYASELDQDEFGSADDPSSPSDAQAPRKRTRENRPIDPRVDGAQAFLATILEHMAMDVAVRVRFSRETGPDEIHLEMIGRDVGRVIGKKGQVLSSLQYIMNRVVNRPGLPRRHVVLDAEGYRYRRESSLANMARRLGEQAVREGKIITFEPMSPRDRRVVHLALAKFPNVVTKSDGDGSDRRVRIIPVAE